MISFYPLIQFLNLCSPDFLYGFYCFTISNKFSFEHIDQIYVGFYFLLWNFESHQSIFEIFLVEISSSIIVHIPDDSDNILYFNEVTVELVVENFINELFRGKQKLLSEDLSGCFWQFLNDDFVQDHLQRVHFRSFISIY